MHIPLYNMSFKSVMSHIPTGMWKKVRVEVIKIGI